MTKSTITRERIQRIIRAINSEAYDEEEIREWLSSDEIMELSRMALAAMDSETVEMPLDYLQGHKDGLEWAARLAEANHPDTGDWLYDDPIELAKAIRKGPDMPPVQPVADSEPDRNPVLAYADSYRDMAKQGVESVPIWSVITDLERNIAPLYRHAQPVPVVSAELLHTAASAIEDLLTTKDRTGAFVWFDLPFRLRSAANAQPVTVVPDDVRQALSKMDDEIIAELDAEESACRAAMLHARNSPAQSDCCPAQNHVFPAQNVVSPAQSPIDHGYQPECECSGCKATARICTEMAVNSLVIPNEMTSEQAYEIGYYYGDPVDVFARGANWMRQHIIDSTLAAAQHDTPALNSVQSVVTVPGKWIPVSERMPDDEQEVLTINKMGHRFVSFFDKHSGLFFDRLDAPAACCIEHVLVTHWMPLPAAPQEVKGE